MFVPADRLSLLRVGELAKKTGKTVRALHLYEDLGLLVPAVRAKGGTRLYAERAALRIQWIGKLQDMGFSLTEVKAFLQGWEAAAAAPEAMERVREIFRDKLRETRETIDRLTQLEHDLQESLHFMENCRACEPSHVQDECGTCGIHGHDGKVPILVDGMSMERKRSGGG